MRVLVVTAEFDRSECAMWKGVAHGGWDVEVICDPSASCRNELSAAGIPVAIERIRHRLDIPAVLRLRKRLRAAPPDAIYATINSTLSVSLLAARSLPCKIVAYRGTVGHLSRWDPACRLTYLHPRVRHIVCVSDAVRDYLASLGLPQSRLTTIRKGHDPAWYGYSFRPDRSEFGIPAGAFLICLTGRIRPVKGVDVLIRALEQLPPPLQAHLLLVGNVADPGLRRMAEASTARDRIHFAGHRKDAAAIAGIADVFVMPSLAREGLPRAVVEAMSQSVPPVVTNVGGLPELVIDGESGLVIPPNEPAALASAIRRLAEDPGLRARLGKGARERISTSFHITTTIQDMVFLLNLIAGDV